MVLMFFYLRLMITAVSKISGETISTESRGSEMGAHAADWP